MPRGQVYRAALDGPATRERPGPGQPDSEGGVDVAKTSAMRPIEILIRWQRGRERRAWARFTGGQYGVSSELVRAVWRGRARQA